MSSPNAFSRSPEGTNVTKKIKKLRQRFSKDEPISADIREFKRPERDEIHDPQRRPRYQAFREGGQRRAGGNEGGF